MQSFLNFAVQHPWYFHGTAIFAAVAAILQFWSVLEKRPLAIVEGVEQDVFLAKEIIQQYGVSEFIALYGSITAALVLYFFPLMAESALC